MHYLVLLYSLFFCGLAKSQALDPTSLIQELGADFPDETQFSIAVVQGENTTYYGYHKKEGKYTLVENQDAVFEIGSLTKIFTSTLFAQAILDKKVKPKQVLRKYIPLKKRPKITLEQLSNHTSGLPRLPGNIFPLLLKQPTNPYEHYDEALLKHYASKELSIQTPAGKQFTYSNLGAGMLGYALAQAYHRPYKKLLQELVFKPFKLNKSYTSSTQVPEGKLIQGLDITGDTTNNWDWQALAPAGCILSCAEDMGSFALANLQASSDLLQLQQTITFQKDETMSIALGWLVLSKEGRDYYFHNGGTGGYTSSLLLDKKRQKAVVLLSNVSAMHSKASLVDRLTFSIMKLE